MVLRNIIKKTWLCLSSICAVCVCATLLCAPTYSQDVQVNGTVALTQAYEQLIETNSTVSPSVSSAKIGDTVTITLQESDGTRMLVNHTISMGVMGQNGVTLNQLSTITNSQGIIYAQLSSTIAGDFQVYAIDETYKTSDNVEILLTSEADVTYTQAEEAVSTPTPTPTPTPRAALTPTARATVTATLTPTSTPTPTYVFQTATPSPTPTLIIPTPSPVLLPAASNTVINFLSFIFAYSVHDNPVGIALMLLIFLLFYPMIVLRAEGKDKRIHLLIYTAVVVGLMFLLGYIGIPVWIAIISWIVLSQIFISSIRIKLRSRNETV